MNYSDILFYFTSEFKPKNFSNVYCMKKTLPLLLMLAFLLPVFATGSVGHNVPTIAVKTFDGGDNPTIKIFPNPATEYIELSENEKVAKIIIYNLTGREMKRFDAYNGEKYYVGDLPKGLYLVQLLDNKNQNIVTQRVSKR